MRTSVETGTRFTRRGIRASFGVLASVLILGGNPTQVLAGPRASRDAAARLVVAKNAYFMRQAGILAKKGTEKGGAPIGAVVVAKGKIIGQGYSQAGEAHDPTAHAEVMAIRDAAKRTKSADLRGATLYTTVAPCPLCLAASYWANIGKIHYAISSAEAARLGFPDQVMYQDFAKAAEDRTLKVSKIASPKIEGELHEWFGDKKHQAAFDHLNNQQSIRRLYQAAGAN